MTNPRPRVFLDGETVPAGVCVLFETGEIQYLDETATCEELDCDGSCSYPVVNNNMGPLVEVRVSDYDEAVAADLDLRDRITQRLTETELASEQ